MRGILPLAIGLSLFSCQPKPASLPKTDSIKTDSVPTEEPLDIIPPDSITKNFNFYTYGKLLISTPIHHQLAKRTGPDFVVLYDISAHDTFGIYVGSYPSYPAPLNLYFDDLIKELKQEIISKAKRNQGFYQFKKENLDSIDKNQKAYYTSYILQLRLSHSNTIWVQKPVSHNAKSMDIALEFPEMQRPLRLHIFGSYRDSSAMSAMLDLANRIKLLPPPQKN